MTSLFLKWVIKISYFFLTGLQHKMSHPYIAFEYIDFCDNVSVNRAALRARFSVFFVSISTVILCAQFQCIFA